MKLDDRNSIPEQTRFALSQKICNKFIQTDIYIKSDSIGCYYPIGSEVDIKYIFLDIFKKNKKLFLPKIKNDIINFTIVKNLDSLIKNRFGILEPAADNNHTISNKIDLLIVPAIAVTRSGMRLGYGEGYYDKFLTLYKIRTISIVYDDQLIKSIPNSEYDLVLDYIITETNYFKT